MIGLQTALCLLKEGLDVTIVARDWPGNDNPLYTSMWAGAAPSRGFAALRTNLPQQWRSTSKMHETHMQEWERQTFMHWIDLTKRLPADQTGLEVRKREVFFWFRHGADFFVADETCNLLLVTIHLSTISILN